MPKIIWVNFLHFYQPPTASSQVVIEAAEKSYRRIVKGLKKNPNAKFTFNITGCLLEKLHKLGQEDLIADLRDLVLKGQVELVGSAAYHPILPLLPEEEVIRQVKTNEEILRKFFGNIRLSGFFAPEMTYGIALAKIVKKLGYTWLLLDEISAAKKPGSNLLYSDKDSGLDICFRSKELSQDYVPKTIIALLEGKSRQTIITATDAELYGLRHLDISANFEKTISNHSKIKTMTISGYLKNLKDKKTIKLRPSSWESSEEELRLGQPYILWQDKNNKIHTLLWELANFCIKTVKKFYQDENISWAKYHLDRGLSSCTFWWASCKDFRLFGAPAWNPDQIEDGVRELLKSVRSINDSASKKDKLIAEKIGLKITKNIWKDHWAKHWSK